jgi:DNA polymerase-1
MSCNTCNPANGGTPRCKLPNITDPKGRPYVTNIQVQGASGLEVERQIRIFDPNRKYRIFFVGEAPGKEEDALGIPFVGRAGTEVFVPYLQKVGFDMDEVFITNMVRCRPPKNRRPSGEEKDACYEYLEREIRRIQPEVIVLLGNTALELFNLNKYGGVGVMRGQLYERKLPTWPDGPTFKIIVTYHPAMFLHKHNPQFQNRVQDDYVFAKNVLDHGALAKPFYRAKYTLADTLPAVEDMISQIEEADEFAFDTESVSLGFRKSPMIMVQFSLGEGKTWVVPMYRHDPNGLDWKLKSNWGPEERPVVVSLLKRLFENPRIAKIAHNIKYDVNVILWHLGANVNGRLWDTILMKHLLDSMPPHGLEFLGDVELATGDWSSEVSAVVGHGREKVKTYDWIPDEVFHQYAATDSEATFRLKQIYLERLTQKPHLLKLYNDQVERAIRTFAKAEWNGNKINPTKLTELDVICETKLKDTVLACQQYATPNFNPGSPDQVAKLLQGLGLSEAILNKDKSKGYSTSKDILVTIQDRHPVIPLILNFRKVRKVHTTYVQRIKEDIDDDGRIRYSFNLAGTTTGRLSCRLLHQIPNKNKDWDDENYTDIELRDIFTEDDGWVYYYGDYSGIELHIFGLVTGETKILEILNTPGADFHKEIAAVVLGCTPDMISKTNRTNVGKKFNFGIIYGSHGHALSRVTFEDPFTCKIDVIGFERSQNMVKVYRERFPMVAQFLDETPDVARAYGCILKSVFGRERRFPDLNDPDKSLRSAAEREAVNSIIQGPAGDLTTRTANEIDRILEEKKVGTDKVRFLSSVHDSLAYGVRKDHVEWFDTVFKLVAQRPIPEFGGYQFKVNTGWSDISWAYAEN